MLWLALKYTEKSVVLLTFRNRTARFATSMAISTPEFIIFNLFSLVLMFHPINANLEGDALYALRRNLIDPANALQSWDPTLVNPCTWFHVTCDKNNHVTRMDLGNGRLFGPLAPELGNLKYLENLELFNNRLVGKIPRELGKLKNLKTLDLYHNNLTGEIPRSVGGLRSLRFLRLNNNNLKGQIPRELTSISSLKILDLSNNDFCGVIPTFGSFSKFSDKSFENNSRLKGPELLGSVLYNVECK